MENTIKRNRPIRIVLKEYVERRKSKIVEARKEERRNETKYGTKLYKQFGRRVKEASGETWSVYHA